MMYCKASQYRSMAMAAEELIGKGFSIEGAIHLIGLIWNITLSNEKEILCLI